MIQMKIPNRLSLFLIPVVAMTLPIWAATDQAESTLVKVGDPVPAFSYTTTTDETVSTQELRGKVLLINFFATWCPPCRAELPYLEKEIFAKIKDDHFKMVCIGREHSTEEVATFKKENKLSFPFAADPDRKIYGLFAKQYIPRNIVVGKDGNVKWSSMGFEKKEFGEMISVIKQELAEEYASEEKVSRRPNIILCMADDLGWGDTGYSGHPVLKTPHLDQMACEGIRFERFYSGAPVCSPTRGSCLTGRHPYRYGIPTANAGHMKKQEITLAEVLKEQGYITGHFGKWHLGTLTTKIKDANRGKPGDASHYSPPWKNGFDVCFATESKVPTWDPMKSPNSDKPYGTYYWDGPEHRVTDNLEGDDSRIIMDRVVPFVQNAVADDTPFFTVIWFHTPHLPVVAGPKHLAMYEGHPGAHYLGCITAMDEQVGRLRQELKRLGADHNTLLWFCSDNGPEGGKATDKNGSAKHLRGRKRSLYEGGVRVPGLLVWPQQVKKSRVVAMPCSTSDYFLTVLDVLGYSMPEATARPYDGISLLPLIAGTQTKRQRPIGFESRKQVSLVDNRYKIYSKNGGKTFELYDLLLDEGEKNNIAEQQPDVLAGMVKTLAAWRQSCKRSADEEDY
jgi:arylsulfatase A-like enzyme/peroxiredoxin